MWTAVSLLFILTKTNPNEIEMDENYTPYNHKRTKIDGVEPKHRGTPATKRGLSNQQVCIITAIQRFGHTIARTLNYGKPSSLDLLRFGECLESKSFVMLDGSNSFHKLIEERLQKYKGGSIKIYKSVQCSFCHAKRNTRYG